MFSWSGWHSETDLAADGAGNPAKFYVIICKDDEEFCEICHRETDDYPLDGPVANEKLDRAKALVDMLNATTSQPQPHPRKGVTANLTTCDHHPGGVESLPQTETDSFCKPKPERQP